MSRFAAILAVLAALAAARAETWQSGVELRVYDLGVSVDRLPRLVGGLPNLHRLAPRVDFADTRGDYGELQDRFLSVVTARLRIPETGWYDLRLRADDGALLWLNGRLVIDHDGLHPATPKDARLWLGQGFYRLEIQHFEGGGQASLKLEWRLPGGADFGVVPGEALSVEGPLTPRTEPGAKPIAPRMADAAPVAGVHPAYTLQPLRPAGFESPVVGLDWLPDQRLAVLTGSEYGELYALGGLDGEPTLERLGAGIPEPLGLRVHDGRMLVLTAHNLLTMSPGQPSAWSAGATPWIYVAGPARLGDLPVGIQAPADLAGAARARAVVLDEPTPLEVGSAMLAPNALAGGPRLLGTQGGSDGPGGQLLAYRETPEGLTASLLAWLPPEVSVRPTQPAVAPVGAYAGQVFVGDMEGGGIRRVYLDQVADGSQGVVFEFTQGLEAGINRLLFAADGSLIAGGAGGSAAFGELGKPGYGLQRLRPNGRSVFEMLAVRARANGLEIELTEPLAERQGWDAAAYRVRSYRYDPETATATDERREAVVSASVGADRRRIFLELPDLEPRRVIELRLPRGLRSDAGQPLWSTGAWYSLLRRGERPGEVLPPPEGLQPNTLTTAERQAGWCLLFDGESTAAWRGFRRKEFPARGWTVEAGTLHLSAGGGDLATVEQFANFEFSLEWKASPGANSGLMYRVTEEVSPSWASGIEVQILDDRGTDALHSAAAAYELYPPENKTLHPAGEWNQLTLVVRGSQVEHWLNGNRVVAYDLASDDFRARVAASKFRTMPRFGKEPRGHLVIQDHGNEFWFRNLKIRVLD